MPRAHLDSAISRSLLIELLDCSFFCGFTLTGPLAGTRVEHVWKYQGKRHLNSSSSSREKAITLTDSQRDGNKEICLTGTRSLRFCCSLIHLSRAEPELLLAAVDVHQEPNVPVQVRNAQIPGFSRV